MPQERNIAKHYEDKALEYSIDFPIMSSIFSDLSKSYMDEALRNDREAALLDREH